MAIEPGKRWIFFVLLAVVLFVGYLWQQAPAIEEFAGSYRDQLTTEAEAVAEEVSQEPVEPSLTDRAQTVAIYFHRRTIDEFNREVEEMKNDVVRIPFYLIDKAFDYAAHQISSTYTWVLEHIKTLFEEERP